MWNTANTKRRKYKGQASYGTSLWHTNTSFLPQSLSHPPYGRQVLPHPNSGLPPTSSPPTIACPLPRVASACPALALLPSLNELVPPLLPHLAYLLPRPTLPATPLLAENILIPSPMLTRIWPCLPASQQRGHSHELGRSSLTAPSWRISGQRVLTQSGCASSLQMPHSINLQRENSGSGAGSAIWSGPPPRGGIPTLKIWEDFSGGGNPT